MIATLIVQMINPDRVNCTEEMMLNHLIEDMEEFSIWHDR